MTIEVVGAGVGRTGTLSLKLALERLLGGPCYHMVEVIQHLDHIPIWHAAARGEDVDWSEFLSGYKATVDWPGASFWPELSRAFPDALVLLSHRSPESWFKSASGTIFPHLMTVEGEWRAMMDGILSTRFTTQLRDADACMAAFERHNEEVRGGGLGPRLLEWSPGDGWEPLCHALDRPVPDEPFPHANSTEEFNARLPPPD
jgi:hypothetical protein